MSQQKHPPSQPVGGAPTTWTVLRNVTSDFGSFSLQPEDEDYARNLHPDLPSILQEYHQGSYFSRGHSLVPPKRAAAEMNNAVVPLEEIEEPKGRKGMHGEAIHELGQSHQGRAATTYAIGKSSPFSQWSSLLVPEVFQVPPSTDPNRRDVNILKVGDYRLHGTSRRFPRHTDSFQIETHSQDDRLCDTLEFNEYLIYDDSKDFHAFLTQMDGYDATSPVNAVVITCANDEARFWPSYRVYMHYQNLVFPDGHYHTIKRFYAFAAMVRSSSLMKALIRYIGTHCLSISRELAADGVRFMHWINDFYGIWTTVPGNDGSGLSNITKMSKEVALGSPTRAIIAACQCGIAGLKATHPLWYIKMRRDMQCLGWLYGELNEPPRL